MDALKTLSIKNTHLPLRERIRLALIENRKEARFANATPRQLRELSRRIGNAIHLRHNAAQYGQHLESAGLTNSPRHLNSLASITEQADRAQAGTDHDAVLGPISEPTAEEVEAALRNFLGDKYDPTR